ncbi:MAG: hypothetical protein ABIB47_02180 [Candidatus Woesearchaeota archaeon]
MKEISQIVAVHCQYMTDNGELAEIIERSKKPVIIPLVPELSCNYLKTPRGTRIYGYIHSEENHYPDWGLEWLKNNRDNPDFTFAQEGYRHCCEMDFLKMQENLKHGRGKQPDPYHEYVCANGKAMSFLYQAEVMLLGKELLWKELCIDPKIHISANNSENKNTLKAVKDNKFQYHLPRNGFDYPAPGLINLPAYRDEGLIILPETYPRRRKTSPVIMFYYNRIGENEKTRKQFFRYLERSVPISELPIEDKPHSKVILNQWMIRAYKRMRDFNERVTKKKAKEDEK